MNTYSVEIKETNRKLTAKERISIKDTTSCFKLDEATQVEDVIIYPVLWAILSVHNEKSENPDYEVYVVVDKSGKKYVTGSQSFWNAFVTIYDEMAGEDEEWGLRIYRIPSKNYKGKEFITCTII